MFNSMRTLLLLLFAWVGTCLQGVRPVYTQVILLPELWSGIDQSLSGHETILKSQENMIIFGPPELEPAVRQRRKDNNTVFVATTLEQLKQQWFFPGLQQLHSAIAKGQIQTPDQSQKANLAPITTLLVELSKVFLMADALKSDKFQTDVLFWTDTDALKAGVPHSVLGTSPETTLKYFYQSVQPQWILFTKYADSSQQCPYSLGEEAYIGRRMMEYETVVPSFMAGSQDVIADVRNAYENFLRVLLENKEPGFQRNALSLLPIRFPSLIPNTASLGLADLVDKVHPQSDHLKVPKHTRIFEAEFGSDGVLRIQQQSFSIIRQNTVEAAKKDQTSIQQSKQSKEALNQRIQKYEKLKSFILKTKERAENKSFLNLNSFLEEILILGFFLAVYVVIVRQNQKLRFDFEKQLKRRMIKKTLKKKAAQDWTGIASGRT